MMENLVAATNEGMEGIQVHGRACFPVGFFYELKGLFRLAWPTSLSILFHYLIQPVSLMFCGHLGKTELASVAMALSMIYISCISIGRGLAFGGDTFFSQTYGSKNKMKMGVYLQKGMLFGILCSFFIWAILINTEKILLLLRQEEHVAKMAQEYIDYFLPGALAYCWIFTLMRYLLCQNSVVPNLLICMASCGINALLHYCLVSVAGLGIRGSAISLVLTYYTVFILLLSYIWFSGIHRETWPGWNRECLEEWDIFGRVAFSSIFMTFIFWLCTEIGTFLAGLLSEEDISAFSICFQVEGFAWMIPLGLGSASTARIGQYLGSKNALGAITTCRVAIAIQGIISVLMAVICYLMRYYIPIAFTSNSDLIKYTGDILPLVAIFLFLEGFGGVGISIIRGTGRQTLGAIIIFISFYIVALPVGIPLMFVTKLRLSGLWWGFVLGLFVQNICLFAFVARMNWQAETDKAQIRAGVYFANQHLEERNHSEINEEQDNNESEVLLDEPLNETQAYQAERDDELIIRPSLQKLILKRLPIFIAFLLLLVAGICVRIFLPKSKVDCINVNLHNASTFNLPALNHNSENESREQFFHFEKYSLDHSVPWCNDTQKPYLQSAQSKLMYSTAYLRI